MTDTVYAGNTNDKNTEAGTMHLLRKLLISILRGLKYHNK